MISYEPSGIGRRIVLSLAILALCIFAASLLAVKLVEIEALSHPNAALPVFSITASIHGSLYYLTERQYRLLSFAKPGVWGGILTAFFLSLIFAWLRSRALDRNG